jgi:hypothetical protein
MNLREQLLLEHTKKNCNLIVDWIGNNASRFDELMDLFLNDEYRVSQRASWPLNYCAEAHPHLVDPYLEKILNNLERDGIQNTVKRNSIRLLQFVPLPKKLEGRIMEICFRLLENPREAVAIKAFSLEILAILAKQYPEIIAEIKLLIEDQLPHQTAGFKSKAKRFTKMFPD